MILRAGLQRYHAHLSQAPHRHDETSVTLILRGQLRERARGQEVAADALSVSVKPAGVVHADEYGRTEVRTCQVVLDPRVHDDAAWHAGLGRWRWIHGGPVVAAGLRLARALARGAHTETVLDLAGAMLHRLDERAASSRPPSWLPAVRDYLDDEIARGTRRISVAEAAAVVQVHPVHLSRVFVAQLGMPVTSWVRWRRIQRAAAELSGRERTLSHVAAECGFADHSHMNRLFRRTTGILPGDYRELMQVL